MNTGNLRNIVDCFGCRFWRARRSVGVVQERIEPRWKSPQALENPASTNGSRARSTLPRSPTGVVIGLLLPLAGHCSPTLNGEVATLP